MKGRKFQLLIRDPGGLVKMENQAQEKKDA